MNLQKLNKQISSCKKCTGLNIPKETMSAPGYGSENAELFVVGQSLHSYNPNTPDRQIPFVGNSTGFNDSGVILYEALEKAGYTFDKKNLFVTNVIHCHPPKNRKSAQYEIEKCSVYLLTELTLIRPKIVMTLGADARKWFNLPKISIGKGWSDVIIPGSDHKRNFIDIFIVAYHPSYINRIGTKNIRKGYIDSIIESIKIAKNKINL